jgi:hypothetical protein
MSAAGRGVLLSASFPSGERAERFPAADPSAIADAVSALTRAVLVQGGSLVFGGHPTISPLVLLIACEEGLRDRVDVHQSRWFEGEVPSETLQLQEQGFGRIVWAPREPDLERSLTAMREAMLSQPLAGGVFIGGMEGVIAEHRMLADLQPEVPAIGLPAPGGAAATLVADTELPAAIRQAAGSAAYPAAASAIARYLLASPA